MAVLSSLPDKREPEPTPIFTPEPVKAKPAAQGHKAASSSTKQSPIDIVSASLGDNELQIRAADLRSVPNPKGQGVFVYVPKTRFRGDERYILWMVIDGKAYAMNGATRNVTPHLLWPREAPADTWRKTALDKFVATGPSGLAGSCRHHAEELHSYLFTSEGGSDACLWALHAAISQCGLSHTKYLDG